MSEELIHIFDNSSCLTRRQLRDYVQGTMATEEGHAVELHLNACPLCSDAVDGMIATGEQGVQALHTLNADFLKDHLPAATQPPVVKQAAKQTETAATKHEERKVVPLWRGIAIAASLLLVAGVAWWINANNTDDVREQELAHQLPQQANSTKQAPLAVDTMTGTAAPLVDAQQAPAQMQEDMGTTASGGVASDDAAPPVMADMPEAAPESRAFEPVAEEKYYSKSQQQTSNMPPPMPSGSRRGAAPDTVQGNAVTLSETSARTRKNPLPAAKPQAEAANGDAAFANGNWNAALKYYKQEMKSPDKRRRQAATVRAAQCYMKLGNKQQATQLLQSIVNEGGPQRRTAKKILRELSN